MVCSMTVFIEIVSMAKSQPKINNQNAQIQPSKLYNKVGYCKKVTVVTAQLLYIRDYNYTRYSYIFLKVNVHNT